MSDDFATLLAGDAVETLWRGHRDSTLFSLIKNGTLTAADARLAPMAVQLAELAESKKGALPVFLHGEVAPGLLSSPPSGAANSAAVHACVMRSHLLSDSCLTEYTAAAPYASLRTSHRLWAERDVEVTFLVFVPKELEPGWEPLAQSGFPESAEAPVTILTDGDPANTFCREFKLPTKGDGLYGVEVVMRAPRPVISGLRLRQRGPAFPIISKGLVVDAWGKRLLPFNNRPVDEWSYHIRPYNDVFPASIESHNDILRIAFRVRLSGDAEASLEIAPAWSYLFRRRPMAAATGSLELFDLRLKRFPLDEP